MSNILIIYYHHYQKTVQKALEHYKIPVVVTHFIDDCVNLKRRVREVNNSFLEKRKGFKDIPLLLLLLFLLLY